MKYRHKDDYIYLEQNKYGKYIYDEVIKSDAYKIRDFFKSSVSIQTKSIIDIGANIGAFSLMSAVLFPHAYRIAIEPGKENFELLLENMDALECLCIDMAVGDGSILSVERDNRFSGSDMYKRDENGSIKSLPLSEILKSCHVPLEGLVIKSDCEGGEYFFMNDRNLLPYLKGCIWFSCEFHEGYHEGFHTKDKWDKWFDSIFGADYTVIKQKDLLYRGTQLWYYTAIKKV